jgi:hypothetical protein
MSRLAIKSELDKLGATLALEPGTLEFLDDIPAEQLRGLRVAVYELMFSYDRIVFQRLAAIAGRLPAGVVARLSERAFGPALTARIAAEMPSRRALAIGVRMPTSFWADIAVHLDPRRTRDLIRQLPVELVVDLALELVRREEFMTMSRFVDFLADDTIQAVVDAVEDEADLLRVAFYMGSKNRVDNLFHRLPPERIQALILEVQEDYEGLLPAFLSLLTHVSYRLKRELGDLAAAQGDEVLAGYVRAAHEQQLWADMLPATAAMSEAARQQVVNLPILGDAAVQEGILDTADDHGLWGIVLPLVGLMDDLNREAVATIVAGKPRATLESAAHAALMGEHWEVLLDLVRRMPPSKQGEFAEMARAFGEVDPDLLSRIVRRAEDYGCDAVVTG